MGRWVSGEAISILTHDAGYGPQGRLGVSPIDLLE